MRIKLTLDMAGVKLPKDYRRGLQAFLYSSLSTKSSNEIHNLDSSIIKLFTFSNILGKCSFEDNSLVYSGHAKWFVTSADELFLGEIYNSIISNKVISIHGNFIPVKKIDVIDNSCINGVLEYHTISPVTIYKTLDDGSREYCSPEDDDYRDVLSQNIHRKYEQLYEECFDGYINIYHFSNIKKRIINYKGYKYIAYDFTFKMDSTDKIHNLVMNCGLGSRNSAGFGMVEKIR